MVLSCMSDDLICAVPLNWPAELTYLDNDDWRKIQPFHRIQLQQATRGLSPTCPVVLTNYRPARTEIFMLEPGDKAFDPSVNSVRGLRLMESVVAGRVIGIYRGAVEYVIKGPTKSLYLANVWHEGSDLLPHLHDSVRSVPPMQIDSKAKGNEMRYINGTHWDDPCRVLENVVLKPFIDPTTCLPIICLVALEDIPAGSELLLDYGGDYWESDHEKEKKWKQRKKVLAASRRRVPEDSDADSDSASDSDSDWQTDDPDAPEADDDEDYTPRNDERDETEPPVAAPKPEQASRLYRMRMLRTRNARQAVAECAGSDLHSRLPSAGAKRTSSHKGRTAKRHKQVRDFGLTPGFGDSTPSSTAPGVAAASVPRPNGVHPAVSAPGAHWPSPVPASASLPTAAAMAAPLRQPAFRSALPVSSLVPPTSNVPHGFAGTASTVPSSTSAYGVRPNLHVSSSADIVFTARGPTRNVSHASSSAPPAPSLPTRTPTPTAPTPVHSSERSTNEPEARARLRAHLQRSCASRSEVPFNRAPVKPASPDICDLTLDDDDDSAAPPVPPAPTPPTPPVARRLPPAPLYAKPPADVPAGATRLTANVFDVELTMQKLEIWIGDYAERCLAHADNILGATNPNGPDVDARDRARIAARNWLTVRQPEYDVHLGAWEKVHKLCPPELASRVNRFKTRLDNARNELFFAGV
eukprot:TRINITY_DN2280_c0_g1_i1.p1 TRINITY_DN2280_c0_g1~~TRINITY_DN2280_c0_g1_i1.p1  ORF type:complete len:695 (-),score=175.44 TRINITY_DN2280_c0_g1_i1:6-2090(-)